MQNHAILIIEPRPATTKTRAGPVAAQQQLPVLTPYRRHLQRGGEQPTSLRWHMKNLDRPVAIELQPATSLLVCAQRGDTEFRTHFGE